MHNEWKKYCTIHNTDTLAYATYSGSYSTEHKKASTLATQWYTTITAVHGNIQNGAQHIHDAEAFRLPERQVASIMISVLILSSQHFNISVLGVVVRARRNRTMSQLMLRQNKH